MSVRSPLRLWDPAVAGSFSDRLPLDKSLCHAMQNVGDHRVAVFHQCRRKPEVERAFNDGTSYPVYPVCRVHASVYDKAIERAAQQDRAAHDDAAMVKSIEARLKALGVEAHVEWSSHTHRHTNRVILTIDALERLVRK